MKRIVLAGSAVLLGLGGLPESNAPAQSSAARAISASDKATGAKAHPQLLQEFGGTYPGPQAAYVTRVGQQVAVQSGLSNARSDFTISLLNSPVNNAFAIPGGYVYVTRQLVALMNDEAELASVLGHEVGHVAARHASSRNQTSTITGIGAILLGVLTGSSQIAQLAGQAAQLYTLRFSRTQEYQADDLGISYLTRANYDPMASSTMLASLAAQATLDARAVGRNARSMPEWASTHPDPASRVARARQKAAAAGTRPGRVRNRDAFLAAIDGMIYDDDPKQGVVDGRMFKHPGLRLAFTIPQGYAMANGAQAVTISGQGGKAQFSGGRYDGNLRGYISSVFRAVAGQSTISPGEATTATVNGLRAAYATARANTQSGQVDVVVFAYEFGPSTAYHFVSITPAGSGGSVFASMFESVRRLSAPEAAAIRPRVVDVVTVRPGDTTRSLAGRMAYADYRLERFLTLNALPANATLRPGQKVKLIVYG